jgi:hypothetical protein
LLPENASHPVRRHGFRTRLCKDHVSS